AAATAPLWSGPLGFAGSPDAARLAAVWAGAAAVTAVVLGLLRSQDRLLGYSLVGLVQSVGVEAAALLLAGTVRPTAGMFLLGRVLAQLLAVVLGLAWTRLRPLGRAHLRLARDALGFGLPLV